MFSTTEKNKPFNVVHFRQTRVQPWEVGLRTYNSGAILAGNPSSVTHIGLNRNQIWIISTEPWLPALETDTSQNTLHFEINSQNMYMQEYRTLKLLGVEQTVNNRSTALF